MPLACRDGLTQRWLPLPYTDADAIALCSEMAPRFRLSGEGIELAAIRRADDRLVGSFGLKRTDWRGLASEIGFGLLPGRAGDGLAVEAITANHRARTGRTEGRPRTDQPQRCARRPRVRGLQHSRGAAKRGKLINRQRHASRQRHLI
jgi:hypothetical protein